MTWESQAPAGGAALFENEHVTQASGSNRGHVSRKVTTAQAMHAKGEHLERPLLRHEGRIFCKFKWASKIKKSLPKCSTFSRREETSSSLSGVLRAHQSRDEAVMDWALPVPVSPELSREAAVEVRKFSSQVTDWHFKRQLPMTRSLVSPPNLYLAHPASTAFPRISPKLWPKIPSHLSISMPTSCSRQLHLGLVPCLRRDALPRCGCRHRSAVSRDGGSDCPLRRVEFLALMWIAAAYGGAVAFRG